MSFIKYEKAPLITLLPEKRASMIFMQPDLYIKFGFNEVMLLWDDVWDKLDTKWRDKIDVWDAALDFRKEESDDDEKFCQIYKTIDFGAIPKLPKSKINKETNSQEFPFIFDEERNLYINTSFIDALKQAGCVDIWYDSIA